MVCFNFQFFHELSVLYFPSRSPSTFSNLTKTAPFRRGRASPAVALESMSMGTYYGLCLLWIFVQLVLAETHPSTVAVPPLQVS